jgi:hypothetical protein
MFAFIMKKLITLALIAISFTTLSFVNIPTEKIAGTYGVCGTNQSTVELKLNADNTFHYIDNSNPKKKINVTGKWSMKKNRIALHGDNAEIKFHNNWKIDEQGIAAKSRKGLAFYRLVNKKNCAN